MKRIKKSLLLILIAAMILFDGSGMGRMFTYADTDGSGAEITNQDIKADIVREHLYEKEPVIKDGKKVKVKTKARKYVERFWDAFAGRDADLSKYEMDLDVTVSGKLPEGTTAQVRYFIPDNQNIFTEQGMCYFDLTLYDADGEVYIPEDPVTISFGGKDIVREIKSDNAPLLYCYEENQKRSEKYSKKYKKDIYAADVNVYKSSYADKKLLQYEPYDKYKKYKKGSDAVRYDDVNKKNGLVVYEDAIDFKYDFANGPANNEELGNRSDAEVPGSAHFVLTTQMTEREFTAKAGSEDGKSEGAEVTVTGHLDKDVQLEVKEIKKNDKGYKECVEKTASEMDKTPEQLESVSAYDIKLVDAVTGKEFEPDSKVKVDVVPEDGPSDKKTEDVQVVKITDDELPVFTLAQAMKEQTVTAGDGNKYKVTATYDATSGIPADAELSVKEIRGREYKKYFRKTAKALGTEHLSFARFFDISLIGRDGKEYHPDDNVSVTIRLMKDQAEAPAKGEKTKYKVVHFGEETEVLDARTKGDAVSFRTGSFSVFAVADDQGKLKDEDGNPVHIRTYRFFTPNSTGDYSEYALKTDYGFVTTAQKIKAGETPVVPLIQPGQAGQEGVFSGWYEDIGEGSEVELADKPYDFNNIPEITEDDEVHLYAVFKKTVHVYFHEQAYKKNSADPETFPVMLDRKVELDSADTADVDISDVTAQYFDSQDNAAPGMQFYAWSYTKVTIPGSQTDDDGNPINPIASDSISVSQNTDLYPLYRPVKWLSLNSGPSGSGATYYSPLSFAAGEEPTTLSDHVPVRPGHEFNGWYSQDSDNDGNGDGVMIADENGALVAGASDAEAGISVSDGKLMLANKTAILYAKWTKVSDEGGTTEDEYYLVSIDTNGGAMYSYDDHGVLQGTGATWFWIQKGSTEPIEEYTHVTRDYVESPFGGYYFADQTRAYYGLPDTWVGGEDSLSRKTFYTTKMDEATSLNTYKKSPGAYRYAGWYEVDKETGRETPYSFGQVVDHDTYLKLHWKKAGEYHVVYDAVSERDGTRLEGTMEDGSSSYEDPEGYADNAGVSITKSATPPEGYEFAGWVLRDGDESKLYRTGESFELPAENSVTVNGEEKVYLEAVYVKVGTASVIFNANGGTITETGEGEDPDWGKPIDSTLDPVYSISINNDFVTVANLFNNGKFELSKGTCFKREGCEFTGWNTERDGSGKHYEPGAVCGMDVKEPKTLYAEWQVRVYFDKNSSDAEWNETSWGDQNAEGYAGRNDNRQYKYDDENGRYYTPAYINSSVSDVDIKPSRSGRSFKHWSDSAAEGSAKFNEKITEETTLYAQWTEGALVPFHVFSVSGGSDDPKDRDGWRKATEIELDKNDEAVTIESILNTYVDVPEDLQKGYKYIYAYAGDSIDKTKIGDDPITGISANGSGQVTLRFESGQTSQLQDDQAVYLVYGPKITEATVKINYVREKSGGALGDIVGAQPGKITYEGQEISLNESYVTDNILDNAVVAKGQTLTINTDGIVVDQSSRKSFNMPSKLDDGSEPLGLIYSRIGVGDAGATSMQSVESSTSKKIHLKIRDGILQWSYDGHEWTPFEEDTPTLYAIYRENGHELKITKTVTKDTEIRDYKKYTVTVTSPSITEESYGVEGTGRSTIPAVPAADGQPGKIEFTVMHGSEVSILGLPKGDYTVTETDNKNNILTAKSGDINAPEEDLDPVDVTDNERLAPVTLDKDLKVALYNEPECICKINTDEGYKYFFTLNSALEYAGNPSSGLDGKATIEMLVDYDMPEEDALEISQGFEIEIVTSDDEYSGEGEYAVISRHSDFTAGSMFDVENEGSLKLGNIVLDGKNYEVSSEMVRSEGTLTIGNNATLKNANNKQNGGAVYISGGKAEITGGSFENNSAKNGGAIYASGGDIDISGGTIGGSGKGNTAEKGGAIYYDSNGTINMTGGTISHNVASKGNGGGVYAAAGTVELKGGSLANNTSSKGNGGAVFSDKADVMVSGNGTTISSNTARSGGALYTNEGDIIISGGTISGNTAQGGNGGAVCADRGSVSVSGGTFTGNTASGGRGGAVYSGSAAVSVSAGTFTGNTAINGSAVFTNSGTAGFTGGNITGNVATQGGAVGVGSTSARLKFSGSIKIRDNYIGSAGSGKKSNVYLDQNSGSIISSDSFSNSAEIGIYVPGAYTDQLFKDRGQASAIFATYTNTYNDKTIIPAFKNDRLSSLNAVALSGRTIMWGKTIDVEVRYVPSYSGGFPPNVTGTTKTINNYYLPDSENSVSSIAEDLRSNYASSLSFLKNTSVFGGAFSQGDASFNQFLTDVNWDSGSETETENWKYVRRYKDAQGHYVTGNVTKLIIYFSEPSYISIENNTDNELDITQLDVFSRNAINGTQLNDAGYGYVYAVNGAIRNELLPITADDLKLGPMKSIKLMFPGAGGQTYDMTGVYRNVAAGTEIPVRINNQNFGIVPQDKYDGFTLGTASDKDIHNTPALPTAAGGSVDIVFGGDKPICKIEAAGITPVAADRIAARTNPDASGKVEYCFATLTNAKNFATNHQLKTTSIQMLVDYLIPRTDILVIPQGYDITLTTAADSSAEYHYDGSRATISRDSDNDSSFITSTGGAGTTFRVDNLKFDGKSLGGNINGGVVMTSNCIVDVNNSEFVNCIANNGGGIYIDKGTRSDVNLSVRNSSFTNCRSKSTASRQGGGAIWTNVQRNTNVADADKNGFYMYNCQFTNCSAYDQGGAVFHRIDSNVNSITTVEACTFTGCEARSAGGMESGAKYVNVTNCTMRNCNATDRNGGGLNFYSLNNANPNNECTVRVTGCTFDHCKVTGTQSNYGGGLRSTAQNTYVTDCTFTYCSGKMGGGIASTNTNGIVTEIHGCVIDNCTVSQNGGGIHCTSKTLTIDDDIGNGNKKRTEIKNCVATKFGGGIRHERNVAGSVLSITNTTIYNNESTSTGDNGNGGGISIKDIRDVTITGSLIQDNTAKSSGGGIYMGSNGTDRRITIDNTEIKGNKCANQGGGLYCNSHFTLKNGSMITGNTSTAAAENAAGVYLTDSRTLTVGDPDATKPDSSSIKGNTAAGGVPSNMRLWSGKVNNVMVNNASSVYVECDLSGRIGVVNASARKTQFGSSRIDSPRGFGYADGTQVFVADDESLFGVADRANHKKLIWRGGVICKITDASGHILYLDEYGTDPAVFDALDVGNENTKTMETPFSYLRNANPALYYKDGTRYTGNEYCVKMLDSYKATKNIFTYNGSGRSITLTTAGRTDDDYPYVGKAGTSATITRTNDMGNYNMFYVKCEFKLQNITLDGGSKTGVSKNTNTRIVFAEGTNASVEVGKKATLQNAEVSNQNGGALKITSGSSLTMTGGEIKNCAANNGGAIYKTESGRVSISGGSIAACSANVSGGAIFMGDTSVLTISGGEIKNCSAVSNGGGVILNGSSALTFASGEIKNCSAANGGGIYKDSTGRFVVSGGSITSCSATSNGGGIYFKNNASDFIMEGGTLTKNSAKNGGGIYIENGCTLRMSAGTIRNNTATQAGGGILPGGTGTRLYFSGRVTISGNKLNGKDCNVELGYDTNEIIRSAGLDRRAYIGVYVPDRDNLFSRHGENGAPFGKYSEDSNLMRFINDVTGAKGGAMDATTIYWVDGTRNVVLRKVGRNYESLKDAEFTVYTSDLRTIASDAGGNKLENLKSNEGGVFFAGEIYYGKYYIKETVAPAGYSKPSEDHYFILTVDKNGVGYKDGTEYEQEIRERLAD